jgi:hypothetical protein
VNIKEAAGRESNVAVQIGRNQFGSLGIATHDVDAITESIGLYAAENVKQEGTAVGKKGRHRVALRFRADGSDLTGRSAADIDAKDGAGH